MSHFLHKLTTIDPLAEKYPNFSPYAHCANNPLKYTDPDGRIPILVPVGKGLVGAALDFATQITINSAKGMNLIDAVLNVDATSVGASFITSAITCPGMSFGAQVLTGGVVVADVAVDVQMNGTVSSIAPIGVGYNKTYTEATIDLITPIASGKIVDSATKGITKAITEDLTAKSAATLTKKTKQDLIKARTTINSNKVQTGASAINDFCMTGFAEIVKERTKAKEDNTK